MSFSSNEDNLEFHLFKDISASMPVFMSLSVTKGRVIIFSKDFAFSSLSEIEISPPRDNIVLAVS